MLYSKNKETVKMCLPRTNGRQINQAYQLSLNDLTNWLNTLETSGGIEPEVPVLKVINKVTPEGP